MWVFFFKLKLLRKVRNLENKNNYFGDSVWNLYGKSEIFIVIYNLQDFENWEPKRVGALVLYVFVVIVSCQRMYVAIRAPYINRQKKELTEAYMEALIPEPTPSNIRK